MRYIVTSLLVLSVVMPLEGQVRVDDAHGLSEDRSKLDEFQRAWIDSEQPFFDRPFTISYIVSGPTAPMSPTEGRRFLEGTITSQGKSQLAWEVHEIGRDDPTYVGPNKTGFVRHVDRAMLLQPERLQSAVVSSNMNVMRVEYSDVQKRLHPDGTVTEHDCNEPPNYSVYDLDEQFDTGAPAQRLLMACGRGYSHFVQMITAIQKKPSGIVVVKGEGSLGYRNHGQWECTVDTTQGYLTRSATFSRNGEVRFRIQTHGLMSGDKGLVLADSGELTSGRVNRENPRVTEYAVESYEPRFSPALFKRLRESMVLVNREPTRVEWDYRGGRVATGRAPVYRQYPRDDERFPPPLPRQEETRHKQPPTGAPSKEEEKP